MRRTAEAVCEILKYLIIHWKCGAADVSKGALQEGEIMISIEAVNAERQANSLHCVTTISSAGSICGGLIPKKFLKEIRFTLPGFSAELNWILEEASTSQDIPRITYFQMIFKADEKLRILMTDSLVIKNFLHKITVVYPKIRFNFSVKVNGVCSTESFGAENEPTTTLSNGIALVVNCRHFVSRAQLGGPGPFCSRIHPVLGQPVRLRIPDDVAGMDLRIPDDVAGVDLLGELILTPAAALWPCPEAFSSELKRISSASIFLYGPSGLPLLLPGPEQPPPAIFKDSSYFIDCKKYHLCMGPSVDLSLDSGLVLPDVNYQVESPEGAQAQNTDPQGQTLLLFLFVDFYSGFPAQHLELWGVHTWLKAHLSAVLSESRGVVRESLQAMVDRALEQHHQAATAHQKRRASLSVAVRSILGIVTGSTSSRFRKICFQALQAADTQEFGAKLDKAFHEVTQHRFRHSCEVEPQPPPEKTVAASSTQDARESSSPGLFLGLGAAPQVHCSWRLFFFPFVAFFKKNHHCGYYYYCGCRRCWMGHKPLGCHMSPPDKNPHRSFLVPTQLFRSPKHPLGALRLKSGSPGREAEETRASGPGPCGTRGEPAGGLEEDALWLREVSNLSEWLSPGARP
ncbi:type 2 DNA topoisomerase 6 subunit B-like [Erinaceus europaeus]|uniref:Type 2 DNA topoisomerase 6 subunit B-like n=1 Tax=Erinaceus europaeus TaxID=9365 RepID=A0ABM3WUA6_ERIEU|nr:type 2 DNA topoisomerase 6 subunit B-like [Erinaceus europaeus]